MKKRNKIIYWISTIWLALGMASTGMVQLLMINDERVMMTALGYPLYFLTLLGTWKLLGVVAILIPKFPLLKEWAYAGFFFAMSGAVFSHVAIGDQAMSLFGPLLLLFLTIISWYSRPDEKKVISTSSN